MPHTKKYTAMEFIRDHVRNRFDTEIFLAFDDVKFVNKCFPVHRHDVNHVFLFTFFLFITSAMTFFHRPPISISVCRIYLLWMLMKTAAITLLFDVFFRRLNSLIYSFCFANLLRIRLKYFRPHVLTAHRAILLLVSAKNYEKIEKKDHQQCLTLSFLFSHGKFIKQLSRAENKAITSA